MDNTPTPAARGRRNSGKAAALVAAGLVTGGLLAGTLSANAADTQTSPSSSSSSSSVRSERPQGDPTRSMRSDEQLLTGDTAEKVRAAVLAKYPDATIQRVESDSDGVYEAHLVTAGGERLTAEVDNSYAVTGEEQGGRGHGRGGSGPRGGEDDADDAQSD